MWVLPMRREQVFSMWSASFHLRRLRLSLAFPPDVCSVREQRKKPQDDKSLPLRFLLKMSLQANKFTRPRVFGAILLWALPLI